MQGDVVSNLINSMSQQAAVVKTKNIAGQLVTVAGLADQKTIVADWEHDGVMYLVQGEYAKAIEDFVTQYVTALND